MWKAQADIISITLIVILSITLVGTAYLWLKPLIEKRQDTIKVEKLLADFDQNNPDSLPIRIEYVAKTRAETSFTVSSDGIWSLSPATGGENYIQFSTFSKVSNVAIGEGWIPYTPGGQCPTPLKGRIGEPSFVVCLNSTPTADGYILTYRVIFRELEDDKIYKIELERGNGLSSAKRTLILKFGEIKEVGNRIVTKVFVLF